MRINHISGNLEMTQFWSDNNTSAPVRLVAQRIDLDVVWPSSVPIMFSTSDGSAT